MDDDDFLAVIAVLERQLIEAGARDIANPRHYMVLDTETDERRLLEPRKRLIEMLAAFGRLMATQTLRTSGCRST